MALIWCDDVEKEEWIEEAHRSECTRFLKARTEVNDNHTAILRGRPDLAKYQPHPKNPAVMVNRFHATRAGRGMWDIQVDYSTDVDDQKAVNPLDRPATISVDSMPREKVRFRDYKGRPILSTAGTLFNDPPPVETKYNRLFVIEKNLPPRLPPWLLEYDGATNSDIVRIKGLTIPPGQLKIQKLTFGVDDNENGVDFVKMHMEIERDRDGWTTLIPNLSFYEREKKELIYSRNGKWKRRVTYTLKEILVEGAPAREPQFLNSEGVAIKNPSHPDNLKNLIFLPFDMSPELPFSRLPLR